MDPEQAKKRKRILSEPEGFLPSKKPQQQQRLHVPKFQSAFDKPSSSKKLMGAPSRGQEPIMPQQPLPERKNPVSMSRRPAPPPPPERQSTKQLKRPEPPVIPRTDPPSKVVKALPPALPLIPTTPMKPLHTPELPVSPDTREMKPLSTIPFSDLTSNDDSIELSSFLLQLQNHPEQKEQDLLISPQKHKHLRGGLAERASRMYKKSHTSLYLWRTSMESKPTHHSDITFRVCKILHTIFTGSHKPSLSITLSRIRLPVRPFTSKKHLVYVITKFPNSSKTTTSCNPADLKEGCYLHIWRPWHEIPLVLVDSNNNAAGLSDTTIPSASLPLPSSNDSLSISSDETIHNIVLLCSRFSIDSGG